MSAGFPWAMLGIARTSDRKAIRAAYAARLKALDVDSEVETFAKLRDARDAALAEAAGQAPAAEPCEEAMAPLAVAPTAPLTAEELAPEPGVVPPDEPSAVPADDTPDRFLAILFPGNAFSGDALDLAEYEEALRLQRKVIGDARDSAIDIQNGIENWLAHYLASAWPRSGPLVEEAGAAFGWDRAAGRLDENPAVAFINERLKAIAFVKQLDQPNHPLHREWVDLRQPGQRSRNPFRKARTDRVQALLTTIRTEYPEIEDYLVPERVASWTEPDSVGSPWGFAFLFILGFAAFSRVVAGAFDVEDPRGLAPPRFTSTEAWTSDERQALLDDLFGPGVEYAELAKAAPGLFGTIERLTATQLGSELAARHAYAEARRVARFQSQRAAADAPFEELIAIKQRRLDMLLLAKGQRGAAECAQVLQTSNLPDTVEPDAAYLELERVFFRKLLDAGLLRPVLGEIPKKAPIPGHVVQQVMERAGMSEATFTTVASGGGTPAEQCAYSIAMLEVMLRRPADVSADLLRMI